MKNKIAILTLCSSERYKINAKLGLDSKKIYCEKHGYDFIVDDSDDIIDIHRPLPWSKINLIKKHLKNYDWVFQSDADVIIKNFDITLESIFYQYPENKSIIFSKDSTDTPNTGNYFIRNTVEAVELLNLIYAQEDFIFHKWWENGAVIHLLKNAHFRDKIIMEEDARLFNSLLFGEQKYRNGDFLIHYVGFINWPATIKRNRHGRIHDGIGKYIGPIKTETQKKYYKKWENRD